MRAAQRRPRVRGNVKNPNDHPHGGTARSIRQARTPWGRLTPKMSPQLGGGWLDLNLSTVDTFAATVSSGVGDVISLGAADH